jgi:hypothetical protein
MGKGETFRALCGASLASYTRGSVPLFQPLFDALNRENVRYLVVGGLATVLHGFARLTADVDLIVDLDPVEAQKTVQVLSSLGLRPRAPVEALQFADAAHREGWIRDKGMRVFSMWDPGQPMREVDLFVELPMPFSELYARSELMDVGEISIRVVSLEDLIALKRLAGRAQDLADIEALEEILRRRNADD